MKRNLKKMSYGRIVSLIGIFVLSFGLFCNQSQQTQAASSQTDQSNKSQSRCKEHNRNGCTFCISKGAGTEMYYELVPHVVLPETIQYNRVAPKSTVSAKSAGTVSPLVATYTAFPSYNLPANIEMRQINQVIYPIAPKMLPMPLPKKNIQNDKNQNPNKRNEKNSVESQVDQEQLEQQLNSPNQEQQIPNSSELSTNQILSKNNSNKTKKLIANKTHDPNVINEMFDASMAILQVANMEEVIPATPQFALNDSVTQTGIFCNSTPKQPVAWSFSSPIFKVAAVPTGYGNGGGYISQFNPHGGVNVGFQPPIGQPQQPNLPPNFPQNFGQNNGANVQVLPNGMLLLSVPPSHHNCGLLRCRDHSWRYMLLPPAPNQASGIFPQSPQPPVQPQLPIPPNATPDPQTQALLYQNLPTMNPYTNPYSQQPQVVPITAMTPYGVTVVGYRQVPQMSANYPMYNQGTGNFMTVANNQFNQQYPPVQFQLAQQQQQQLVQMQLAQQQIAQHQLAQQQLAQQQLAQQKQQPSASQDNTDSQALDTTGKDNVDESSELKMPLPINGIANGAIAGNMIQDNTMNLYANPYAMYALQSGNLTVGNNMGVGKDGVGITGEQTVGMPTTLPNQQFNVLSNPYFTNYPMTLPPQPYGMSPYGFNPYMTSVYPAAQFGGQFGNQFLPLNQPYIPGYMPVGLQQPVQQPQANQGNGLSMSDVLLLMMLMKENNKPQRRLTFFERIAERRAARRQRAEQNDPFNQIMQLWNTPFYADSTARMPASNAYPYGYFGAQPAPINTANYGGYHNLYYGNTTYY
ncbi:MAG: hypothetical protein LBL39_01135 [Planctomycetaceae bacterium]|jgi:hypothetical protein|nr:hypothetical protein [Planctomycetaceae bacterium]